MAVAAELLDRAGVLKGDLADRDPDKASVLFRRLLKRPRFDWARDGEQLLRAAKADYFARVPRLRVGPLGERLAAYARRR
jgi:hypothetical protein